MDWKEHFAQFAEDKLDASSFEFWHGQQALALMYAGPVVRRTVLDAGCGGGALSRAAVGLGAIHATGFDMPGRTIRDFPGCSFVAADLAIPASWPVGEFDLVMCVESLYYVADPVEVLWHLWTKVGSGGRLLATVGNASSLLVEKARVDFGGDYRGIHAGSLDALGKNLPGCSKFDVFGVWIDPEQRFVPFRTGPIGMSAIQPHRLIFVAQR